MTRPTGRSARGSLGGSGDALFGCGPHLRVTGMVLTEDRKPGWGVSEGKWVMRRDGEAGGGEKELLSRRRGPRGTSRSLPFVVGEEVVVVDGGSWTALLDAGDEG